jgi:hypothetical protein
MTPLQIVQAAIPNATDETVEFVVWCRTPWPCVGIGPRDIYRAARRWQRAHQHGIKLCEMCDRIAKDNDLCDSCAAALYRARLEAK